MFVRLWVLIIVMCVSPIPATATTHRVPGQHATIQAAINATVEGDTVLVGPGIYTGLGNRDLDFGFKDIVVRSELGAQETVIDVGASQDSAHRGFVFKDPHTRAAVLDGFTIINGHMSTPGGAEFSVEDNSSGVRGKQETGRPMGSENAGARHDLSGAGIQVRFSSSPTLRNLIIRNCFSEFTGGGLAVELAANPRVENVIIEGCAAGLQGGGLTIEFGASGQFINCTVIGCRALDGGGVHSSGAESFFTNCTIAGNTANRRGGGIDIDFPSRVSMKHCIVWGNCARGDSLNYIDPAVVSFAFECSVVDTSRYWDPAGITQWIGSNIFSDPQFCNQLDCALSPQLGGSYDVKASSVALPQNNACAMRIGSTTNSACQVTAVERKTWEKVKAMFR